ncbi:MAG: LysR family transcriptional regulator, partial [Gammaproteobacteria bacterium]
MAIDIVAAMRVFTAVVDSGSFAGAADRLTMSRGMATRYVAQLEQHLGVRLLHRTTRKQSLTEEGADYYQRAVQILASIEDAEYSATKGRLDPRGILRISTATGFAIGHLDRAIIAYLQRYPNVEVDLINSERMIDLVDEGFDLAIRVAKQLSPGLIARRLAPVNIAVCASPEYLKRHGTPTSPEELLEHNCLFYSSSTYRNKWRFCRDGVEQIVQVKGNFHVNEGKVLVNAALAGMGILYEPDFLVTEHIKQKRLVHILKDWETDEFSLYAVYANRQ